jgi:UbiD family decarboxylase
MGKPIEIAIACNVDPAIHMAAGTGLSYGEDEYEYAGALRGSPVELVKCDTVDLEVPAHAEFVLEGVCYPEEQELTGRHSNPVGYYDVIGQFPCVKIHHITHRKNPQWYATMEMVPPFDHNYIALLPVEGELLADLRAKIPEVNDVVVTPNMGYIVQLSVDGADKPHVEFGKYVIHAVWGAAGRWARTAKWVTIVGPDVDPYDLKSVEWAVMTRVQPFSDTIINKSAQAMILDVSAPRSEQFGAFNSEQIGIDATIKVPERFKEYAPVSNATAEEVAAIREKLKDILE